VCLIAPIPSAGRSRRTHHPKTPRETTSAVAGALCGPTITGPENSRTGWRLVSDAESAVLAAQPETGCASHARPPCKQSWPRRASVGAEGARLPAVPGRSSRRAAQAEHQGSRGTYPMSEVWKSQQ